MNLHQQRACVIARARVRVEEDEVSLRVRTNTGVSAGAKNQGISERHERMNANIRVASANLKATVRVSVFIHFELTWCLRSLALRIQKHVTVVHLGMDPGTATKRLRAIGGLPRECALRVRAC